MLQELFKVLFMLLGGMGGFDHLHSFHPTPASGAHHCLLCIWQFSFFV